MHDNGKETLEIRILRKIENKLLKILETNQASLFYWKYCKSKQAHSGKLPSSSRCGKEATAFFTSTKEGEYNHLIDLIDISGLS